MMHTEEQAKALWCPMVRYLPGEGDSDDNASSNAWLTYRSPPVCHCIASQCAMWRWGHPTNVWEGKHVDPKSSAPALGFCGIAGKPS